MNQLYFLYMNDTREHGAEIYNNDSFRHLLLNYYRHDRRKLIGNKKSVKLMDAPLLGIDLDPQKAGKIIFIRYVHVHTTIKACSKFDGCR